MSVEQETIERQQGAHGASGSTRMVGDWELGQQIGIGSFSVVWYARNLATGQEAAVKEIPLGRLDAKLRQSLESEVSVLKRIRHPNVVALLDLCRRQDRLFLILEFCSAGDLSQLIRTRGPLPEKEALYFFQQLAAGLRALREADLIHRDLKPQNLLLASKHDQLQLKIADFGFVRELQSQAMANTLCGSPLYMAPEILRFQRYDASADLWSVGTILFEMVCGRPPFTGQNPVHLLQNIEKAPVRIPERAATRLSPMCQDLILRLLRRRPQDRLSWAEFFGHPFLSSGSQSGDDASSGTFMEGASGEALTDSVLQAEIRDVARQLDCTKLSREATHVRPSQQDIRDHRERLSRRVDEGARQRQPGDSLGASEGGLLGGGYVIVDGLPVDRGPEAPESGQAAESVAAQDHGVGRMRRVMLDGLPGHLSEPSTLLQLPIAVEEGLEHAHPAARLHNHQCSAGAVWECARDVAAQGQWFDALSLMLLCLSILEEGHVFAQNILRGVAGVQDSEVCKEAALVEPVLRGGMQAVVQSVDAVRLRVQAEGIPEPETLPDAAQALYTTAIQAGRAGAVAELMGDTREAAMRYVQAAGALHVMLQGGPRPRALSDTGQDAGQAASPKGASAMLESLRGVSFEPGHRIQLLHYLGVLTARAYPLLADMPERAEPGVAATVVPAVPQIPPRTLAESETA